MLYLFQDIETEDDGEIVVRNGEIALASVEQSRRQYLLTWLMTTRGGFAASPQVGWGGESFFGMPNAPHTHRSMERDMAFSLGRANDIDRGDVEMGVSGLGEEALLTVLLRGTVVEPDGTTPEEDTLLQFLLPFTGGEIHLAGSE